MSKRFSICIAILTLCLVCGCAQGEPEATSNEASAKTESPAAIASQLAPVSVLVSHRVADYELWKRTFDADKQSRQEASCRGHYLKRGLDDTDRVYVYCLATDAEKLRTYLDSAELVQAMQRAGVIGEPEITLMRPVSRGLVAGEMLPGIIVMHSVENYETWREGYDALDSYRRDQGIVGQAVSQSYDDPNRLIVYHQARDERTLRAFVESDVLREAMREAGVVGEPDIRFIDVVDFASY